MLVVTVFVSSVGLGLFALPLEAIRGAALGGVTGAVAAGVRDVGAESAGYYLRASMAAPSVVNIANMNISWVQNGEAGFLGVKLGALNTTVPIQCPGKGVALQLDAQTGDYAAKLSRLGGNSDTVAARVEWECKK